MAALGAYDGVLRRAVRQLKFDGRRDLARPLGEAIGRLQGGAGAAWVSVPPHCNRLRSRGYDHTALLARAGCRAAGTGRYVPGALARILDTPPLYSLPREQRAAVLAGAFVARGPLRGPIVLVDDILTTGATAREAATILRAAGATRVHLLVVARA